MKLSKKETIKREKEHLLDLFIRNNNSITLLNDLAKNNKNINIEKDLLYTYKELLELRTDIKCKLLDVILKELKINKSFKELKFWMFLLSDLINAYNEKEIKS